MIIERYPYEEIKRKRIEGKRVYDTASGYLTSVTTILDKTKSEESKQALNEWRKRVGNKEASRITREAANVGTLMHGFLEDWIEKGEFEAGNNLPNKVAKRMANTVIDEISDGLDEVWGTEVNLYYPGLYAGTTDLVGVWKGNDAIMDFKQTNKPKKREWIADYFCQLAAYSIAHNELFGTNIREGHVFMCSRDCEFQHFAIEGDEFDYWTTEWSRRVGQFYSV